MKNENQRNEELKIFDRYFEALTKWDKTDHIGNLAEYLKPKVLSEGVNEMPRLKVIFKKMIVKMVACSMGKTLNKHCFVLMGANGIGKTSFLNWLLPPGLSAKLEQNFELSNLTPDDFLTNFWIQIDELTSERKQDIVNFGKTLMKDQVRVRLPYSEKPKLTQKRCNFVATTNDLDFLKDKELQKRCVCFYLGEINWSYLDDIDINQVWAQAFELYKSTTFNYKFWIKELTYNEMANIAYHGYFLKNQFEASHK